jgi:DNA-binding CsgD family transcriptional regulator
MIIKWTIEEEEYLMNKWGKMTVANISKKLGRSENAVLLKAHKLGLKNQVIANGTYLRPKDIADMLNIEIRNIYNWLDYGYINYRKFKIKSIKKYQITMDSFKEFLHKYQNLWNAKFADLILIKSCFINCTAVSNYDDYTLPLWLEEKISKDVTLIKAKEYKSWTTKEEEKLIFLLQQGKNNKEIASILNRSIYSVQGKVRHIKNNIYMRTPFTDIDSDISMAV